MKKNTQKHMSVKFQRDRLQNGRENSKQNRTFLCTAVDQLYRELRDNAITHNAPKTCKQKILVFRDTFAELVPLRIFRYVNFFFL